MTSKSIYQEFKPTYLYIKQHSITGKLYFGKTTNKNPEKYPGSGTMWKCHYKKHGKEFIVTLWCELFDNKEEIQEFALSFSKNMNIVESDSWLNLISENGLHGGSDAGMHRSNEARERMSVAQLKVDRTNFISPMTGKHHSTKSRKIMSEKATGRKRTTEENVAMSIACRGINTEKQEIVECPHCNKIGGICLMHRYHFNNCKMKDINVK